MYELLICGTAAGRLSHGLHVTPGLRRNLVPGRGMKNKTETRAEVQGHVATMFTRADANKDGFVIRPKWMRCMPSAASAKQAKMAINAAPILTQQRCLPGSTPTRTAGQPARSRSGPRREQARRQRRGQPTAAVRSQPTPTRTVS